jgi:hypothetical protein
VRGLLSNKTLAEDICLLALEPDLTILGSKIAQEISAAPATIPFTIGCVLESDLPNAMSVKNAANRNSRTESRTKKTTPNYHSNAKMASFSESHLIRKPTVFAL